MLPRHAIADADWERIKNLLPGRPGQPGWVARDNRLFIEAVLWIAKTGAPWRDLPERFGNWNSVCAVSTAGPERAPSGWCSRRWPTPTGSG